MGWIELLCLFRAKIQKVVKVRACSFTAHGARMSWHQKIVDRHMFECNKGRSRERVRAENSKTE